MRIGPDTIWLLGASLAQVAKGQSGGDTSLSGQQHILFDDNTFKGDGSDPNAAVYSTVGHMGVPQGQTFSYTAIPGVTVNNVYIKIDPNGDPIAAGTPTLVTKRSSASVLDKDSLDTVLNGADNKLTDPEEQAIPLKVTERSSSSTVGTIGNVTIEDLAAFSDDQHNQKMMLEVDWTMNGQSGGKSYSRLFTVALPGEVESQVTSGSFNNPNDSLVDVQPTGAASSTSSSPTIGPAATASPAAASSSGSSGGLSTGAIAGIAVACGVVGLALIGALIWWLLRRRSRSRAGYSEPVTSAPYGSPGHGRTADLIAEKEATAGVSESQPHSPYSDDGNAVSAHDTTTTRGAGETNGGAVAAGSSPVSAVGVLARGSSHHGAGTERSYTPYSDSPASPPGQREDDGVRSTTPAGGRYAHLMEDTMSPEERARIEEEERQLDAAIEQAGHRR